MYFGVGNFDVLKLFIMFLCVNLLIPHAIMVGHFTLHSWAFNKSWHTTCFSSLLVFLWDYIITISELHDMYCEVWARCKWGCSCDGALRYAYYVKAHLAWHMHQQRYHVDGRSYDGMVLTGGRSLYFPAVMAVKYMIERWATRVLATVWID